jgi:hypothetical protein
MNETSKRTFFSATTLTVAAEEGDDDEEDDDEEDDEDEDVGTILPSPKIVVLCEMKHKQHCSN